MEKIEILESTNQQIDVLEKHAKTVNGLESIISATIRYEKNKNYTDKVLEVLLEKIHIEVCMLEHYIREDIECLEKRKELLESEITIMEDELKKEFTEYMLS